MLGAGTTRSADDSAVLLKRNFESAKSALASGDLPEAERRYYQTVALGLRQVSNISVSESRFDEATRELEQALKFAPTDPDIAVEAAIAWFRAELQIRPADPLATYHLGYALLAQGHPEDAVPLFREVIKALPGYESAHFELGRALLQQGDTAGAIEGLETARKLVPDHDATYFQLSQAYRRAGRTQEAQQALAAFQKLIETNRLKKRESLEMEKP